MMDRLIKIALAVCALCLPAGFDAGFQRDAQNSGLIAAASDLAELRVEKPRVMAGLLASSSACPLRAPLPEPPALAARIRLWEAVYGEYDSDQIVLYHAERPNIVYGAAPDLPGGKRKALARLRKRLKKLDDIVKRYDDPVPEIEKYHDAPRLLEIYRVFEKADAGVTPDPDRFAKAMAPGQVRSLRGKRDELIAAYGRASRYLPVMETIFEAENVPPMLTRLVFVESMFDRDAVSDVGALGYWQFMDGAARPFLEITPYSDERRDPVESTIAAAKVLARNRRDLGSWPLAVTAYNAGQNRMRREVEKTGAGSLAGVLALSKHRAFGFCVNNFYPQLIGVIRAEEKLGLNDRRRWRKIHNPLDYETVSLQRPYSAPELSMRLGIEKDLLVSFNPSWTPAVEKGFIRLPRGYRLRVPRGGVGPAREALNMKGGGFRDTASNDWRDSRSLAKTP